MVDDRTDDGDAPRSVERPPLSCDIHGHAWPPKFMTGEPIPPREPVPPSPPEPLSDPGIENWCGAGLPILAGVLFILAALTEPIALVVGVPFLVYLGALAYGAWQVRPRPGRRKQFRRWMLPILLQFTLYLLLMWQTALQALAAGLGTPAPDDRLFEPLLVLSAFAGFLGWIPAGRLHTEDQRGGWILAAQTLVPLCAFFAAALIIAIFSGSEK